MIFDNTNYKLSDTISVEKKIDTLIPLFLENKLVDLELLRSMHDKNDVAGIQKMGHNWKGSCASYGFHYLSDLGQKIEKVSTAEDMTELFNLIETIPIYLKNIEIIIN